MKFIVAVCLIHLVTGSYDTQDSQPDKDFVKSSVSNSGFVQHKDVNFPSYEEHTRSYPIKKESSYVTEVSTVTLTRNVRVTSTSDVWVTDVDRSTLTVSQYFTKRNFVREQPQTVTLVVTVTRAPVDVETVLIEKFPVRTLVSKFTSFRTVTSTVDLWFPITHRQTSYEVETSPVMDYQTLYQVLYSTTTVISTEVITLTKSYGRHRGWY